MQRYSAKIAPQTMKIHHDFWKFTSRREFLDMTIQKKDSSSMKHFFFLIRVECIMLWSCNKAVSKKFFHTLCALCLTFMRYVKILVHLFPVCANIKFSATV